jgi:mannose/cellobiose epimerase-like protein (N-acyl-D-glucosamine 2-epimerase family)
MIDLAAETERLLAFAEGSRHPQGGFAWLRADGTPDLDRPRELWITTRMTHVFALGELLGHPGAAELVAHGLDSLRHDFRDGRHGGWFAQVGGTTDKRAYEHVFVVLAAASAGDAELLGEALEVLETRFWDEEAGALVDVWNRDWTWLEPYRGANANMHGVEAMLATGDPLWRSRAVRVTKRLLAGRRLNEHFDADWNPLPDYNRDAPAHPFRPYGSTIGHWFEWARLAYTLDAGFEAEARRLFTAAVQDGWDGSGFVYTVDWDGRPVVRDRLHWVLCEAIGAAAVLGEDALQAEWWALAERVFIDRVDGSWRHELDPSNRPASTVWNGKPDVYHALQATLIPRVRLRDSLAAALRERTPPSAGA